MRLIVISVSTLSVALALTCGQTPIPPNLSHSNTKIVGGDSAVPYSWPWQVVWCSNNWLSHKLCSFDCGATIIDAGWAMTAGHCVYSDLNPNNYKIKAGVFVETTNNADAEQVVSVRAIHLNPQYDPVKHHHDVALIELASPLTFSDHVQPACLPKNDEKALSVGGSVWVTGWGATKDNGDTSRTLRQVTVPVLDISTCENVYPGQVFPEVEFCAGHEGVGPCDGDSGSAVVAKADSGSWFQYGLVSWGSDCAEKNGPGVYQCVSGYCDWINTTTGGAVQCQDVIQYSMPPLTKGRNRKLEETTASNNSKTTFLSLPNEVLTKIIAKLDHSDRKNLATINDRLEGVDSNAGYHRFSYIEYNAGVFSYIKHSDCLEDEISHDIPVLELTSFFNHATVDNFVIKSPIDDNEDRLQRFLKTVNFKNLSINIFDENSCRTFHNLIHTHKTIEEIEIHWHFSETDDEGVKQIFMNLPPIKNYRVYSSTTYSIDDDVMLHLVRSSETTTVYFAHHSISASALEKVFEMVYSDVKKEKEVCCCVPLSTIAPFFSGLNPSFFDMSIPYRIIHDDSGAIFRCFESDLWQVQMYHSKLGIMIPNSRLIQI